MCLARSSDATGDEPQHVGTGPQHEPPLPAILPYPSRTFCRTASESMCGVITALQSCRLHLVAATGGVGFKHHLDFVPYSPENHQLLLVGASGMDRIVKAPMVAIHLARKHRT